MPASNPPSQELASFGRRTVKVLAGRLLPTKLLVCRGPDTLRRVALTFDDGPAALTAAYLDVLEEQRAKATFFLLGGCCALRPEGVIEIARRGHEIGSHGYTHRTFSGLPRYELLAELQNTATLLPETTGTRLVRPPKGALSPGAFMTCAGAGYTTVLWSHDSDDCRVDSAEQLLGGLQRSIIGSGEILLFHEGQRWTLEALPAILKYLREEGYELVTVSELLRG